jgi:hypothetical protein
MDEIFQQGNSTSHHYHRNYFLHQQEHYHGRIHGNVTDSRIVGMYPDRKKDKFCMHITMGGNFINYQGDCGTPTANLLTVKLLLNSIISTCNAKFMTLYLKDFYLMTPIKCYEYFRMKLELFSRGVIDLYDLNNKVDTVECTIFPRQVSLLRNFSNNIYSKKDTPKAKSLHVIGNMNGGPSASH